MKHRVRFFTSLLLLWAVDGFAIGLGKPVLQSHLGEQLNLTMTIMGDEGYTEDQLIFQIPKKETYENLHVEYDPTHTDLRFTIKHDEKKGLQQLQVTSAKPVNEPYLHFIVELNYPEGRVFKDVSVLLDTPK